MAKNYDPNRNIEKGLPGQEEHLTDYALDNLEKVIDRLAANLSLRRRENPEDLLSPEETAMLKAQVDSYSLVDPKTNHKVLKEKLIDWAKTYPDPDFQKVLQDVIELCFEFGY